MRRPGSSSIRTASRAERRSSKRPSSPRATCSGLRSQCSARNSSGATGAIARRSAAGLAGVVRVGVRVGSSASASASVSSASARLLAEADRPLPVVSISSSERVSSDSMRPPASGSPEATGCARMPRTPRLPTSLQHVRRAVTVYVYAWGNNARRAELRRGAGASSRRAGRMDTVLVRFLDTGERVTTSRRALRRASASWGSIRHEFADGAWHRLAARGCQAPLPMCDARSTDVPTIAPVRAHLKSTFSIVAADPEAGEVGCAVQSKYFAVGTVVPWAKAGVGRRRDAGRRGRGLRAARAGGAGARRLARGRARAGARRRRRARDAPARSRHAPPARLRPTPVPSVSPGPATAPGRATRSRGTSSPPRTSSPRWRPRSSTQPGCRSRTA